MGLQENILTLTYLLSDLEMDPRGNVKAVKGSYGSSNPKVYAAGGELNLKYE